MAKRKVEWTNVEAKLTVKVLATDETAEFDLATIKGMVVPEGIAFDAMLHGFRQKLADSIAGVADPSKIIPTITAVFDKIKETGEWKTRRPKAEKVDINALFAKAKEMDIDPAQMELLMSLVGQARASK